jgi:putative tryptophan/tyrosine transport system substrate-binding protein
MRRRTFTAGALALVVATAPFAAPAQVPGRKYRFAMLTNFDHSGDDAPAQWHALRDELRRLGFVEGQNLTVDRYVSSEVDGPPDALADAIVASTPELIFAGGAPRVRAVKAKTRTIPVVFIASDPVANGLVESIARPGGNLTGGSTDPGVEYEGKRLEMLLEAVPSARRVAYLTVPWQSDSAMAAHARADAQRAKVDLVPFVTDLPTDAASYRRAYARMVDAKIDAVLLANVGENRYYGPEIVELMLASRLPTIMLEPEPVRAGGLLSLHPDLPATFRMLARYIAQILKGEKKPSDLPVWLPDRYELAVNLKTAKALGLTLPETVMVRATEVIE